MNYEDMSDSDISALVAKAWFGDVVQYGVNKDGSVFLDREGEDFLVEFDPCKNPSDASPIIVENEISIEFLDGGYVDVSLETDFGSFSPDDIYPKERAFEAAMICFLKMKDAEK